MNLKDLLRSAINRLLRREESVDGLLSGMHKIETQLTEMAARCRAQAVKEEQRAQALLDHARKRSEEAERAVTVAARFNDLTK